jgi:cytochrome c biogenesis protein CcmG/thiol:disulfide interchange protein DsbE
MGTSAVATETGDPAGAPAAGAEPERERERRRRSPLRWALQLASLALVAGLLALLVWRVVHGGRGAELVSNIRHGKRPPAPAFSLPVIWPHAETWPRSLRPALADGTITLAELRGHPVVLNIWASWCVPCAKEAPELAASARTHAGSVAFLGLDVQDFKSDARHFLERYDVRYVSVRDGSGATGDAYGITGVPETYWIDARGLIVDHYAGQISRRQLEDGIRKAQAAR